MFIEVIVVSIIVILLFGLLWSFAQFYEFSKTGVKYERPLPYFGNLFKTLLGIEHFSTLFKRIYDSFPNEKYVGIFEFFSPTIIIKDPNLIKKITIKDFDHFQDVPIQINEEVDSVFGRILLALKGNKWRKVRSKISPVFTSAKMKNMFNLITDCAEKFISHYEIDCEKHGGDIDLDVNDLTTRFTNDVIASVAFSLEIDSLKERDNYFYKQAAMLSGQSLWMVLKFAGFRLFPNFMKKLGIPLIPASSVSYLKNLIIDTMNEREISGEYRPDLVHLLNEAKKGVLKHDRTNEHLYNKEFATNEESSFDQTPSTIELTDDDLLAQAIVFILAGFTTSSTLLSFLLYELALNPEIQERLQEEVDEILKKNNNEVTYADITHMKYLDMVVSETLRKWPPIPFLNRLCTEDYDLGPINDFTDNTIKVKKENVIWIPIHSIHMDSAFWPNPMKFDPERFSDESKEDIKPQTYLPFGSGPRNCIGARFALMEIKILLFYFLSKFNFNICEKTPIPMTLSKTTMFLESKDGYWLNMKLKRQ